MEIRLILQKLVAKSDLSVQEAGFIFDSMLEGNISDAQIASTLIALAMKGESVTEILAAITSMKNHCTKISPAVSHSLIDTCGTGGDSVRTFNISTAAAIVASAAGAVVAKHGNRSSSGLCGSADFMEEIGMNLNCDTARIKESIEKIKWAFLFAPTFHPLMRNLATVRKQIGIRSIFNIAGPLSNPCDNITGQVVGVYSPSMMDSIGEVCAKNVANVMIVSSSDGLDELSSSCTNKILHIQDGKREHLILDPKDAGIDRCDRSELTVSSKEDSIACTLQTIYGYARSSQEDVVVLNSAAALLVSNLCSTFEEGIQKSRNAIRNGLAKDLLSKAIAFCGSQEKLKIAEEKYLGH